MKTTMRLKIIMGVGVLLLVLVFVWIHDFLLLPDYCRPTFSFQKYTNAPTGQLYAVVKISNIDVYTISFHEPFLAIPDHATNPVASMLPIKCSLTNLSLAKGNSWRRNFFSVKCFSI
jgi:hypothetical protein